MQAGWRARPEELAREVEREGQRMEEEGIKEESGNP